MDYNYVPRNAVSACTAVIIIADHLRSHSQIAPSYHLQNAITSGKTAHFNLVSIQLDVGSGNTDGSRH